MRFARVAVPVPLAPLDMLVDYRVPEELVGKIEAGSLVDLNFGRQKIWGLVFELVDKPSIDESKVRAFGKLKLPKPIFDRARLDFLLWLSRHYLYPIGEVCETAIPASIRQGTDRTLLKELKAAAAKRTREDSKQLNAAQANALATIRSLHSGSHLLWGVTGSGKTEVYLQAIEEKASQGKGALLLVPEISLTPQLWDRFERRFPGQVAVFHSGLKPTQLRKAWLETLAGEKKIAIGARSALFAPVQNLGILIVDEEHDGSYKQEDRLRYNARDGAIKLGELARVPVILGSATPSAETVFATMNRTDGISKLPDRAVGNATLPTIELVDLRDSLAVPTKETLREFSEEPEIPTIKGDFFLSERLRAALDETLAQGKQSILFLNRRGLGSQEFCRSCGHAPGCPNCDVKLTPHRAAMVCHYCGYTLTQLATCGECGATDEPFLRVGIGTEAIEEAVKFHFPKARTLRLDRDTTESHAEYEQLLGSFARHEADILVGTQMVAKGHDFPNVTLVGIILADLGLTMPDYRADERSMQLLLQVAGRAGRGLHPGRVILQTFQPDHPVFESLNRQKGIEDYEVFLKELLGRRQFMRYPPFGSLCLVRFDGIDEPSVREAAQMVGTALKRIPTEDLNVLGPVTSPLSKLRGRHRWQILLKSKSSEESKKALHWILERWESQKLEKRYRTRITVDVDPVSML